MSDSKLKYTHTLACLYSAQGYPQQAEKILADLKAGYPNNSVSLPQNEGGQSKEPADLFALAGQWIDLLRRRRFLETKSSHLP
ncbi:MAG: hypothetical protein R6U97_11420 [Desulfosalsimonas sp.]